MKKEANVQETTSPGRRSFMKIGGCSLLSLLSLGGAKKALGADTGLTEPGRTGNIMRYWEADGLTPVQKTVRSVSLDNNAITARVDGLWKTFKIKELDQGFKDFQSEELVGIYEKIMANPLPVFGGVYCPAIISHGGIKRGDSQFKLNGAYKFVFPVPKQDRIDEICDTLMSTEYLQDAVKRRTWMKELWADTTVWDYRMLVGRDETVVGPNDTAKRRDDQATFPETHTFRNLMENPLAVVLFLSATNFTSYEVRSVCHYAPPAAAGFTARSDSYEDKISRWINVLGYSSHQVDHRFPAMIFYVVEAFDNSMVAGTGEGTRVTQIKSGLKNMYARAKTRLIG